MTDTSDKTLAPLAQKFVLHWGEMGTRWGINRTVAQIHALLIISDRPRRADEIAETLGIARSNVSTSLRELQNWGIVRLVHFSADRRDHFESMQDIFEMFRVIARERKKREVDPTVRALRDLFELTPQDRVLQFASLGWDTCLEEILPTLTTGATLVFDDEAHSCSFPRWR